VRSFSRSTRLLGQGFIRELRAGSRQPYPAPLVKERAKFLSSSPSRGVIGNFPLIATIVANEYLNLPQPLAYPRFRGFASNSFIKVSVKSPPKGGKANRELLEFLSDLFDCRVEILKGERSTRKVVILKGVDYERVLNVLSTKSVK